MPQDLAALLVEEGAVSKADIDRAVARQAQLGGALDTALLELGLIGEGHLLSFLSHASGLPAVPVTAFGEVDARARRVFPAKVAERHRLAPFALDGRELSIVAVHPIDGAAIDEIGFMLSLNLVPYVGPEWRVHALIQRLYGGQLPARLAKLAEASMAAPPAAPQAPAAPASVSIEEAFFAAGDAGTFTPVPAAPEAPPHPPLSPDGGEGRVVGGGLSSGGGEGKAVGGGLSSDGAEGAGAVADLDETSVGELEPERPAPSGFGRDDAEPAEPLLAALEQAVDAFDALSIEVEPPAEELTTDVAPPTGSEPGQAVGAAGVGPRADAASASEAGAPQEEPEPEPEEPLELDRSAPPRWSPEDAAAALAAARHRDEVVLTALRYTRDFFEFAALFAVTRDAVVGHDGLGVQEDARSHCRGTAIYASDPGVVKTVLETRAPYLGHALRDAVGTANILDGLWRGTPRTVLLYPILLGERPVAVLYADNGEAPVSPRRLGDLLLFLSTVGSTFERIIRARKRRRPRAATPPPAPPPPTDDATRASPEPSPEWMAPPPAGPEVPPPRAEEPRVNDSPSRTPGEARVEGAAERASEAAVQEPESPAVPPPGSAAVEDAMAGLLAAAPGGPSDRAPEIVDLILDPDPGVAAAAREALVSHRRDPAVKPLPERLRRALLSGVGERPLLAARALGALRDVESIPILIQALESGSPETAEAAAEALAGITMQRHGPNPQRWLRWWKENRGRSRAEWLFAALTAPDRELRLAASGELRSAAEPPVRYSVDLPAAELDAASRSWWVWWSRQGLTL